MHINNPIINAFSINTEILWAINLKWYIYKLVHLNTRQNHTTKSWSNPSVPTPPPLSHLQKTEGEKKERETRDKKAREICRPDCNVAMDTSGNHKAKNLNGAAVVCRTKNTPIFYSVHLSNTNTRTIYYRWPSHTELIKDTFMHKRNIEAASVSCAAVLSLRARSELSHCGRRTQSHTHTFTQWPTSTTWNGKINSRWHGMTETKPDRSEEREETDR